MGRFDKIIEFEKRMAESDGFDIEKVMRLEPSDYGYVISLYNKGNYATDIHLYAKMGIHKYNLQKGTNLQFSSVKKYNERSCPVFCAYYITLVAKDLDSGGSLVPFQTKVIEERFVKSLTCDIARPKGQPVEPESVDDDDEYPEDDKLPQWPSDDDDAFKDKSRYYIVKKSVREKHDWIRMYMELAFLKANMVIKKPDLSSLSFVKVAVESPKKVERPRDRLKAANATFYIKYMYRLPKDPLYGIAVIRRTVDKDDGAFTLMFDTYFA